MIAFQVFSATPLIHRLVTSYTIEDLKPNTSYEMGLFFIPFPGQATELQSERNIHVTTALENGMSISRIFSIIFKFLIFN